MMKLSAQNSGPTYCMRLCNIPKDDIHIYAYVNIYVDMKTQIHAAHGARQTHIAAVTVDMLHTTTYTHKKHGMELNTTHTTHRTTV